MSIVLDKNWQKQGFLVVLALFDKSPYLPYYIYICLLIIF